MTDEATNQNFYPNPIIVAGFTEFIFVPVPGECDQYYGITTYSNGSHWLNYITDVIWCKIDLNLNSGLGGALVLPGTGLKLNKEQINCTTRGPETDEKPDYNMHIEVTTELSDGNRYLFASNQTCVSVMDVTTNGISFIDGYQTGGGFGANLRSEMEVFKTEDKYEVAMSYYNDGNLSGISYVSIFNFDMSAGTPMINHYSVAIAGEPNQDRVVKGLEYSLDGLTLYASIMTVNSDYTSITSGNNIVFFKRGALGSQFTYGGVITSGSSTQDFGLGMLEKGDDHQLWVVGDSRLGTLADINDPTSTFTPSAMSISNQLTNASLYSGSYPSSTNIFNRKLYLLVDQIDGEDYSMWASGSDLYPSNLNVACGFPYTFPYQIPANANVTYTGLMSFANGILVLQSTGILTINYSTMNKCEYEEEVRVTETEEIWCESSFTRAITETVEPEVLVYASCDHPGVTVHLYYLYEETSPGVWQLLDTQTGGPNQTLTGLYNNQTFKIVHVVHNPNSVCHPWETTIQIFTI